MRFIRRHLAAYGLAVALLQSALQAVLPAGLCCSSAPEQTAAPKAAAHCCTAQSDADGTCPMHHGSHRASGMTESGCRLVCASRGEQALLSVALGGPLPAVVTTIASTVDVGAAVIAGQHAVSFAPEHHTPPPRA